MKVIKALGVDASLRNFGFASGIIDIRTMVIGIDDIHLEHTEEQTGKQVRKNSDDLRCAKQILTKFHSLADGIACIMAEVPQGAQSARASWTLGISVGILASAPKKIIEVSPIETKLATVGSKTASKDEMIQWAVATYPHLKWLRGTVKGQKNVLLKSNEHLADACAVIHAGVRTDQFQQLVGLLTEIHKSNLSPGR